MPTYTVDQCAPTRVCALVVLVVVVVAAAAVVVRLRVRPSPTQAHTKYPQSTLPCKRWMGKFALGDGASVTELVAGHAYSMLARGAFMVPKMRLAMLPVRVWDEDTVDGEQMHDVSCLAAGWQRQL
jgi:hypothetical protein